ARTGDAHEKTNGAGGHDSGRPVAAAGRWLENSQRGVPASTRGVAMFLSSARGGVWALFAALCALAPLVSPQSRAAAPPADPMRGSSWRIWPRGRRATA